MTTSLASNLAINPFDLAIKVGDLAIPGAPPKKSAIKAEVFTINGLISTITPEVFAIIL